MSLSSVLTWNQIGVFVPLASKKISVFVPLASEQISVFVPLASKQIRVFVPLTSKKDQCLWPNNLKTDHGPCTSGHFVSLTAATAADLQGHMMEYNLKQKECTVNTQRGISNSSARKTMPNKAYNKKRGTQQQRIRLPPAVTITWHCHEKQQGA